jgi:hypothetical protein
MNVVVFSFAKWQGRDRERVRERGRVSHSEGLQPEPGAAVLTRIFAPILRHQPVRLHLRVGDIDADEAPPHQRGGIVSDPPLSSERLNAVVRVHRGRP